MEPPNNPDYETTFSRVATILERVTEALEQQARHIQIIDEKVQQYIDEGRLRDAETADKVNGLIDLVDRHLREHRES